MKRGGQWELAPAYDLTGRRDSVADSAFFEWQNRHALSVNGKFSSITDDDMLRVGEVFGIGDARAILQEVKNAIGHVRP